MHTADKPGEGSGALTRQVLKEYAGLHHQLSEVHGVKVRGGQGLDSMRMVEPPCRGTSLSVKLKGCQQD